MPKFFLARRTNAMATIPTRSAFRSCYFAHLRSVISHDLKHVVQNELRADLYGSWAQAEGHLASSGDGGLTSFSDVDILVSRPVSHCEVRKIKNRILRLFATHRVQINKVSVRRAEDIRRLWNADTSIAVSNNIGLSERYMAFWAIVGIVEASIFADQVDSLKSREDAFVKFYFKNLRNFISTKNRSADSYLSMTLERSLGVPIREPIERSYGIKLGLGPELRRTDIDAMLIFAPWGSPTSGDGQSLARETLSEVHENIAAWVFAKRAINVPRYLSQLSLFEDWPEQALARIKIESDHSTRARIHEQ